MKEIKAYSNPISVDKAQSKVALSTIKDGDVINYRILEKLDSSKYIVNILGKKIRASINEKVPLSGMAKVFISDNKLTLKIIKESSKSLETLIPQKLSDNTVANMLINNSVKVTPRNINYLDTVLKYMNNMTETQKSILLNYISKNIYFSVNELEAIFSRNVYIILLKTGIFSKIPKTNNLHSENSKAALNNIIQKLGSGNFVKDAVESNGYFLLLLSMLDTLDDDERELKDNLKTLIGSLAGNRKNLLSKKNVYFLPVPISLNREIKEARLFIETDRDDKNSLKMTISVFDESRGKESFRLSVKSFGNGYNITISIFEKELYDKYIKNESFLLSELEAVKKMALFEINVGAIYEV